MESLEHFRNLFTQHFSLGNLANVKQFDFKQTLSEKINSTSLENFIDPSKQRDLSLKFHWGHNHDFGDGFMLQGNMKNRHIEIISKLVDNYELPFDLSGKKILDIGVWTGGTCLLLVAMGAQVYAIEEVIQYSEMVNYLAFAFGIENRLRCYSMSLYEFLPMFANTFDYILYSGVIYHVTDPLLSLREVFTALKDNGTAYLETLGIDTGESVCYYEGPGIHSSGNVEDLNRGGWNYFVPSPLCLERWCLDAGFQQTNIGSCTNRRIMGSATRTVYVDFCRAGVSRKDIR